MKLIFFIISRRSNNKGDPPDDSCSNKGISSIYLKCPLKINPKIPIQRFAVFFEQKNSKKYKGNNVAFDLNIAKNIPSIKRPVQFLNGLFAFINKQKNN